MILSLTRKWKGPTSLVSPLYVSDVSVSSPDPINPAPALKSGNFECYILENKELAIPAGTYRITLYDSPKHGPDTPLLNGVPQRSFIEIHPANWAHELLGCLAPGREMGNDCVNDSVAAYKPLQAKIKATIDNGEMVLIDIKDPV